MTSVVVGLSGGVDSAVAAYLLQQKSYTVSGIFMKNWDEDDGTEYCTSTQDFDDAQRIAEQLKIDLGTINFSAEYWERVFSEFLRDYESGLTPNPDILCNREIKFGLFLDYVKQTGIETIATGHYAQRKGSNRDFGLYRSVDQSKDQTYFLSGVKRSRLSKCLFPLATHTKSEVREIARSQNFHVHDKKDSTGICFIGERRFSEFMKRYISGRTGEIVDTNGSVIGSHPGLAFFTLGQRKGLAVGGQQNAEESPWYVLKKIEHSNQLVVTQDQRELLSKSLKASSANWLVNNPKLINRCQAVVRYRQKPAPCEVSVNATTVDVTFDYPQRAVTPGQYVVFYQQNHCLGGARIESVDA